MIYIAGALFFKKKEKRKRLAESQKICSHILQSLRGYPLDLHGGFIMGFVRYCEN